MTNESELLDRLRGGDRAAFDAIFRAEYPRLVGIAASMLRDHAAAEEVAQDVMLELWRRHASLVVDTSLTAYLIRSTRNRALNVIRHERVVREAEPSAAGVHGTTPATDAAVAETELDAAIRKAVAELPPRCREVFELSRVEGLKYVEIADALSISVKTVEAQMGKALRLLRERLADWIEPG